MLGDIPQLLLHSSFSHAWDRLLPSGRYQCGSKIHNDTFLKWFEGIYSLRYISRHRRVLTTYWFFKNIYFPLTMLGPTIPFHSSVFFFFFLLGPSTDSSSFLCQWA